MTRAAPRRPADRKQRRAVEKYRPGCWRRWVDAAARGAQPRPRHLPASAASALAGPNAPPVLRLYRPGDERVYGVTGEAGEGRCGRAADRPISSPGCTGRLGCARAWCARPHRRRRLGRRQPQQRDDQPAPVFSPPHLATGEEPAAPARPRDRLALRMFPPGRRGRAGAEPGANPISASSMRSACLNYATIRASPPTICGSGTGRR